MGRSKCNVTPTGPNHAHTERYTAAYRSGIVLTLPRAGLESLSVIDSVHYHHILQRLGSLIWEYFAAQPGFPDYFDASVCVAAVASSQAPHVFSLQALLAQQSTI